MMTTIKRLFWDIETSPNVGFFWRAGHKQFVNYDSIIKERAVICIGYKWQGERTVHALQWDGEQNDRTMLERFTEIAAKADELVAHNGDDFDMPWYRTRCMFHGIPTDPYTKTVDTLQIARRKFCLNSNRLDYIARLLGLGGKIKTELDLWKAVVNDNDRNALAKMVAYCKRDVSILERVWMAMAPHVKHKTHAGILAGKPAWTCPECGSESVKVARGPRVTADGTKRYQMQCMDCGRSYTISEPAYQLYLKAKKEAA